MAGTQGYIKLQRRFADYRSGEEGEPENLGFFYSSHLYAPHTWPKLLKRRCTVVVGTSGSGKSVEFKQQAEGLRKEGKAAFFCRLEDLANLPLQSALEMAGVRRRRVVLFRCRRRSETRESASVRVGHKQLRGSNRAASLTRAHIHFHAAPTELMKQIELAVEHSEELSTIGRTKILMLSKVERIEANGGA